MEERIGSAVTVAILIAIISASGFFIYTMLRPSPEEIDSTSGLRAAIVDQATFSPSSGFNKTFIDSTTRILNQTGFEVDYYPSDKVTVEFYRNLPKHGYDIIILRVHSALLKRNDEVGEPVSLFTSEPYSGSEYISEQINDELFPGTYHEGSSEYFTITPNFIERSMKGNFDNATIMMMGCDGLRYESTAQAFIKKDAKVYISWNGPVSSGHADAATIHLLRHLLTEKLTIKESIDQIDYDPIYYTRLKYYPLEIGNQKTDH